jgi:hypothetical protein
MSGRMHATLLALVLSQAVVDTAPSDRLHLGVDLNVVPFFGPGVGLGGSGRFRHFGFGLYVSSQRIAGLAQTVSFSQVTDASTDLRVLVSGRVRYHPFATLSGPYLALDFGAEEWVVSSGGEQRSIVSGLVTPKLGAQWFPFEKSAARWTNGLWLGASVGTIFIITPETRAVLSTGGSATVRDVIITPELFVGWWW